MLVPNMATLTGTRHWSLWFDIKIVLRTIGVVISDDNARQDTKRG